MPVRVLEEMSFKPKDWVIFYGKFQMPDRVKENGGGICFKNMTGKASVYLNGELVTERKSSNAGDVVVPLKPGLETAEINIIMQPDARGHILLADIVYLMHENDSDPADKKDK